MKKNSRVLTNAYKRELYVVQKITPLLFSAVSVALKRVTDMSNDDIEYILDTVQELLVKNSQGEISIVNECINEVGLDFYCEPDKAKAGKNE